MDDLPRPHRSAVVRVSVRNFASIASCDIELGPLTVLIGFNAAGKSNFINAIWFVSEALNLSLDQAVANRGGLDQLLHRSADGRQADSFTIELGVVLQISEEPAKAIYGIEIGRSDGSRSKPVVRREWCTLTLGNGLEMRFVFQDGSVTTTTLRTDSTAEDSDRLLERLQDVRLGQALNQLLLPRLAVSSQLSVPEAVLREIRCYELDSATLRRVEDAPTPAQVLGARGEYLGQVLGRIATEHPETKKELDSYLRSLVPQALGVDERRDGDFSTIEARFWDGEAGTAFWEAVNAGAVAAGDRHVKVFRRQALSEGTVRSAGVLTALFQPEVLDGSIPLVVIEEPETAIHPSRVGALYDAMFEASRHCQVLVTTQSSELLDSDYADPAHLLVVEMVNGATQVGPVDEPTRQFLVERPSQLPELHRQGQLRPALAEAGGGDR